MPSFVVVPLAMALLANLPDPDAAPSSPPAAVAPQQPESHWYGGAALAVDGAVIVGVVAADKMSGSNSSTATTMLYGLAGAYLVGVPIVHFVHGNREHAAQSFLLRLGGLALGVVGVYAVALSSPGCGAEASAHQYCPAVYGLLVPPVAAMLIDDLVVARELVAPKPPARTVAPRVLVQPGLALFGVGGTF